MYLRGKEIFDERTNQIRKIVDYTDSYQDSNLEAGEFSILFEDADEWVEGVLVLRLPKGPDPSVTKSPF